MRNLRERDLFAKARLLPKRGLGRVVECVVLLWFVLADPDVPAWCKALAAAALAYFVCPFDAIFDGFPGGLVDDAALVVATVAKVAGFATPETRERARAKRAELGL